MKRTELGIELDKSETEELMKTGYVLNEDSSICVVDQDGEYLVFERMKVESVEELMKTGYVLIGSPNICIVDQDGEYLVFEIKQFTQLSIYDYLEEGN